MAHKGSVQAKDLINADKMVLQNYGRPYDGPKTTGGYYALAKSDALPDFA